MQTPPLIKRLPDQEIEINPVTAEEMNIHLRDWLWIEIPRFREHVNYWQKLPKIYFLGFVHAVQSWWYPEKQAQNTAVLSQI